jgi:hypothetical protein
MLGILVRKSLRVKAVVGLVVLDVRVPQVSPHGSPKEDVSVYKLTGRCLFGKEAITNGHE